METPDCDCTQHCEKKEMHVASMLWDLFDMPTDPGSSPKESWDTIQRFDDKILEIFDNELDQRLGKWPTISDFRDAWEARGLPSYKIAANHLSLPLTGCIDERLASDSVIMTVAGSGLAGYSGDQADATTAQLNHPLAIGLGPQGDLFIADTANQRVRRVDAATRIITTVAGNGTQAFAGDGGPATEASLSNPVGVAVDAQGNLFIADAGNNRIRRVDALSGTITTIAGTGTAGGSCSDGLATAVQLFAPGHLFLDGPDDLLFADMGHHCIRRLDMNAGMITTVAGTGSPGFSGDNGPASEAELRNPGAVALDADGNLLIADSENDRIRRVDASTRVTSSSSTGETRVFAC
jgi:sugar lactone lactonase YvrE